MPKFLALIVAFLAFAGLGQTALADGFPNPEGTFRAVDYQTPDHQGTISLEADGTLLWTNEAGDAWALEWDEVGNLNAEDRSAFEVIIQAETMLGFWYEGRRFGRWIVGGMGGLSYSN